MCPGSSREERRWRRKVLLASVGRYRSVALLMLLATVAVTLSQWRVEYMLELTTARHQQEQSTSSSNNINNSSIVHKNDTEIAPSPQTTRANISSTAYILEQTIANRTASSTVLVDSNVSLCTQIRNEPPQDVIEWLTYYRFVYGVKSVCVIDDASAIDYATIFDAFEVRTIPSRKNRNQNWDLCRSCLGIVSQHNDSQNEQHQRVFISDVDEYLLVQDEERFAEYLQLFSQVSMYALNFANAQPTRNEANYSSNSKKTSSSLLLETTFRAPHYCRHESYNHSLDCTVGCWYDTKKSILRDVHVAQYLTHTSKVKEHHGASMPSITVGCDVATVHHYFIRSKQDFASKFTWDENSKWKVHERYEHVLDHIDHYTSVEDRRLQRYVLETVPDYAEILNMYRVALLAQ